MSSKDLFWKDSENRKRKYNTTQRKCVERTGKQVAAQCDPDSSTRLDQTVRNVASGKFCQQAGDDSKFVVIVLMLINRILNS